MTDKKPTYEELSDYGKCIANEHVFPKIEKLGAALGKEMTNKDKEEARTIVLDTIGIDGIIRGNPDVVAACEPKKPPNTPVNKAVRTQEL